MEKLQLLTPLSWPLFRLGHCFMPWPTIILCDFSDCPRTLRCSFIKPPLTRAESLSHGQDVAKVLWPSLNFPSPEVGFAHLTPVFASYSCSASSSGNGGGHSTDNLQLDRWREEERPSPAVLRVRERRGLGRMG